MFQWSKRSATLLLDLDIRIKECLNLALNISNVDISIISVKRDIATQKRLFMERKSQVQISKHNCTPYSLAVDIAPWVFDGKRGFIPWDDNRYWYYINGILHASQAIIRRKYNADWYLRNGADWNGNGYFDDQNFNDLGHWELVDPNDTEWKKRCR